MEPGASGEGPAPASLDRRGVGADGVGEGLGHRFFGEEGGSGARPISLQAPMTISATDLSWKSRSTERSEYQSSRRSETLEGFAVAGFADGLFDGFEGGVLAGLGGEGAQLALSLVLGPAAAVDVGERLGQPRLQGDELADGLGEAGNTVCAASRRAHAVHRLAMQHAHQVHAHFPQLAQQLQQPAGAGDGGLEVGRGAVARHENKSRT